MNIMQRIFSDHFNTVASSGIRIRKTVFDNVEKMLQCGNYKHGYALFYCEHCNKFKYVPFRCKSRFCTTCGNLYSIRRSTAMSFKLIRCQHRHCVFTIPQQLRPFFLKDRSLLDCLFHSVRDVLLSMFLKLNKSQCFKPGFICVLHTFGRSLQWNPHIHVLISEGAAGNNTVWRPVKHFNYTFLRNAFCTVLLNQLKLRIGHSFKKIKAYIYKHCQDGFYVFAKPSLSNNKEVAKYIGRYLGRPVIATSRIIEYDGQFVTFKYNRHEDNKLIIEKVHATDFIKKLIIHIPEKHYKMIRFYGLYPKKHKNSDKLFMALSQTQKDWRTKNSHWRVMLLLSFGYDPLKCDCGHTMSLFEICHKGTPLIEKYRRFFNTS